MEQELTPLEQELTPLELQRSHRLLDTIPLTE
jgi:hypothetical protein